MRGLLVGLVVLACATAGSAMGQAATCRLVVHVDGFRNSNGAAGVTVFKSAEGWPENNDKSFQHAGFPISANKATAEFSLPPGRYAVAAIHDENSNHKLDRNLIGIPKEGFGFANNPKIGLSAASFDKAAIQVGCPVTETTIHLIYK